MLFSSHSHSLSKESSHISNCFIKTFLQSFFDGFILTGCGDDPKTLVKDGIENKSGSKISEVYNKKKDEEKNKFAKEVTITYFEQAKVDMAQKFKPDFHHYKLDDSIGDLLSHIDSGDNNFTNLRKLHQLFQRRRTDGDKIVALHRQLGLGSNRGDLRYDNAGPIDEYTLYIFHTVPFSDLQPVYAAIGYQVIGNEYVGRHVMPDVNNYLAMVHVPKNGSFFTQGQGVYTFYAAQAGEVKFKDAAGFERNLPLLQLIPDGQVGAVRQFINLHKTRVEMQDILIPQFINNVLADPGGEFKTGVFSVDNQKPVSVKNTLPSNAQSVATRAEDALVNFHSAITNKQYQVAFNLLSPDMQNYVGGYDKFVKGYGTTESSQITEINVISKNDSTAQLAYMLEAKDKFKAGTLVQHFSGTAKLVNNGGWKIAEVTAKKVGEQLIQ